MHRAQQRIVVCAIALLAVLVAAGCGPRVAVPVEGRALTDGTITQISDNHGNAYTSIRPDQYEALKLTPGQTVIATFNDRAIPMTVGQNYTDVEPGQTIAVLHREGLTFAIRDANFSTHHRIAVGDRFTLSRR